MLLIITVLSYCREKYIFTLKTSPCSYIQHPDVVQHNIRMFSLQTSYLKQGILYYYYNQVYLFSIHPTRIMYIQQ